MTVEVEATETTIDDLLQHVAHGDHVRLLKNGAPIATVVTRAEAIAVRTPEQTAAALEGIERATERSRRLGLKFDLEEFKADREFGRR